MCYNVIIKHRYSLKKRRLRLCLSLVFIVGSLCQVSGQYGGNSIVRHTQGTSELESGIGFSDLGLAGSAYYLWHINHQWFMRTGGTYEFDLDQRFDTNALSWDLLISRYLLARRKFFLSIMLGPTIVFEKLEGVEWKGKFFQPLPGGSLGIGFENYLSRRFAITTIGMMRMIPASEIGRTRLYLLLGLKYTLSN